MKKYPVFVWWSFIFIVFACSPAAMAQKTEVEPASKLQKIIVFTDKAMITKDAAFSVKKRKIVPLADAVFSPAFCIFRTTPRSLPPLNCHRVPKPGTGVAVFHPFS